MPVLDALSEQSPVTGRSWGVFGGRLGGAVALLWAGTPLNLKQKKLDSRPHFMQTPMGELWAQRASRLGVLA